MIYAIGDVHGRNDLLVRLLDAIVAHAGSRPYRVVFLGDIIDRGPESRRAMDTVCRTLETISGSVFILGNHEEMLLNILDNDGDEREHRCRHWLRQGGTAAFQSYRFMGDEDADLFAQKFELGFPKHVEVMRNAASMVVDGDFVFVHAGVRPGIPLAGQSEHDLRWIRREFLEHNDPFEKFVIHGHTPVAMPDMRSNRLNIDTGAVASGRLTAVAVSPDGLETLMTTENRVVVNEVVW